MIVIEYLIILIFLSTLVITAGAIYSKYIASSAKEKEAKDYLSKALLSNDRKRIENALIIYSDQFDNKTKEALKLRVDELMIEEDDENLERKINEL